VNGWRIVRPAHVANPLSGSGSARTGNRWNSPGVRMAYASTSRPLAVLEMLVHVTREYIPLDAVLLPIDIPDELISQLHRPPEGWNEYPYGIGARSVGDQWIRQGLSLAMLVPSAVLTSEYNLLINPAHAKFAQIEIGKPEPHAWDRRLFGMGDRDDAA